MVAVDGRRAVTDRQRPRVLRRDPRLPGRLRDAPRAGVDRCAHTLVRAAARHGRLHGPLPRAPRRAAAAAAARGRRRCEEARRAGERCAAAGNRLAVGRGGATGAARCTACAATSRAEDGLQARRAAAATSRSRASPCCGWPRARWTLAAAAIRRALGETSTAPGSARGSSRPASRSCWRPATARRRGCGLRGAGAARGAATRTACWARWRRRLAAPSS